MTPVYVPLMNNMLFSDLIAAIGITGVKRLKKVKETNESIQAKLQTIANNNGPVSYVSTNEPPQFFNRGVMHHTDSWSSHNGVFIPEGWAKEVRRMFPDLLAPRILRESVTRAITLPPVPSVVKGMEVIESKALVSISNPKDVVKEGEYVVAFLHDWTDKEAMAICHALYWMYGTPYDVMEIARKVLPFFPKFKQFFVCSSILTWGMAGQNPQEDDQDPYNLDCGDKEIRKWMTEKNIDFDETTPKDNGMYWFSNPKFTPLPFWCDINQAKEKI